MARFATRSGTRRGTWLIVLWVTLLVLGWASLGHAQAGSQNKAVAEALFDEGLAMMKRGDYLEASRKLENSQRVEPAVGTLMYLGECYARLGRSASAWATFREAASLANASGQEERAAQARQRSAELESKLGYLSVSIAPETAGIVGLTVSRAGEALDVSLLGSSLPVDPGPTRVEARAPGYLPFATSIEVKPGERSSIRIPPLVPDPAATSTTTAPGTSLRSGVLGVESNPGARVGPSRDELDPGKTTRLIGLVTAGAGVVAIGVGSYFGISAITKNRDAEKKSCSETLCQRAADLDEVNQARRDATISTVAFSVGGAALLGGALTYWLAPAAKPSAWRLAPRIARGQAALFVEGLL